MIFSVAVPDIHAMLYQEFFCFQGKSGNKEKCFVIVYGRYVYGNSSKPT
jgi:hypothetical protein